MQRPRISHAHRRWRAHSHMFHGCRDVTKDSCEHVHAEVAAWSRPTSQGCTCNRQGEKEGSKVKYSGPRVRRRSRAPYCRHVERCVGELGYPLRSTEVQRGAFMVYLMVDVIKGQFGRTVVIL